MCPARLEPPTDPRLRDPKRRPEVEKAQEILPEWSGVLLMANKFNKIGRIADVTCCPAPPVPLPERVQINKEFIKLNRAEYLVCIGLPFLELHKTNFKYHPDSEWSKFLNFMFENKKFATYMCEGWQLFFRPPQEGPRNGFSFVRVHYRRQIEALKTEALMTNPAHLKEELEVVEVPALSSQDRVSKPTSLEGVAIDVGSQTVLKGVVDYIVRMSHQPQLKRLRAHGEFCGFGNTASTDAPSSSLDKDLNDIVSKASEKSKSIGNCVSNIDYDIGCGNMSKAHVQAQGNGNAVDDQVLMLSSQVTSIGAKASLDLMDKYLAKGKGLALVVNHGATSGAAPAFEERMEEYYEAPVYKAPIHGSGRGVQGLLKKKGLVHTPKKLNGLSKEARSGTKVCNHSNMIALRKVSQWKEKLMAVQGTPLEVDVPLSTFYSSGDFQLQKGSQVVDKNKGVRNGNVDVLLKKQARKQSSNGNESIKRHIVHALPKVPDQFIINLSNGGGLGESFKEQMPKQLSSANGALQKRIPLSLSHAKQKSLAVANAPSSRNGRDLTYSNGIRRSKPQEIKVKKNTIKDMQNFDSADGFTLLKILLKFGSFPY